VRGFFSESPCGAPLSSSLSIRQGNRHFVSQNPRMESLMRQYGVPFRMNTSPRNNGEVPLFVNLQDVRMDAHAYERLCIFSQKQISHFGQKSFLLGAKLQPAFILSTYFTISCAVKRCLNKRDRNPVWWHIICSNF
jgi:hypothetical protein